MSESHHFNQIEAEVANDNTVLYEVPKDAQLSAEAREAIQASGAWAVAAGLKNGAEVPRDVIEIAIKEIEAMELSYSALEDVKCFLKAQLQVNEAIEQAA